MAHSLQQLQRGDPTVTPAGEYDQNHVLSKRIVSGVALSQLNKQQEAILKQWIDQTPTQEQERFQQAEQRILNFVKNPSRCLDLSNLSLTSLSAALLETLPDIQELDLSNNDFTEFPNEVSQLKPLKIIKISHNHLSTLSAALLETLPDIQELDLSNNDFTEFPNGVSQLKSLKIIKISHNRLSTLPTWLSEKPILVKAIYNQLPEVDNPLMENYIEKMLSYVQETYPGEEVTTEEIIPYLLQPQNRIQSTLVAQAPVERHWARPTPEGVAQLQELLQPWIDADCTDRTGQARLTVEAYNNQSQRLRFCNKQLPPIAAFQKLPHLINLDLANIGLYEVPEELQQLTQLKTLDLSENRLRRLPEWLADMPNLEVIIAEDNCLRTDDQGVPLRVNEKYFKELLPSRCIQSRQAPGLDDHSMLENETDLLTDQIPEIPLSIPLEEKDALYAYVFSGAYKKINAYRRSLRLDRSAVEYSEESRKRLEKLNNQCNSAIKRTIAAKGSLKPSTRLFRVVVLPNHEAATLTAAKVYQPAQLLSTSSNLTLPLCRDINKKPTEGHRSVLFIFDESAHLAANIKRVLKTYGSDECIFPIEAKFMVTNTGQNGDFYLVYLMAAEAINSALLEEISELKLV